MVKLSFEPEQINLRFQALWGRRKVLHPEKLVEALLQKDLTEADYARMRAGGIVAPRKYQIAYDEAVKAKAVFKEGSVGGALQRLEREALITKDQSLRRRCIAARNALAREHSLRLEQGLVWRHFDLLWWAITCAFLTLMSVVGVIVYFYAVAFASPLSPLITGGFIAMLCGVPAVIFGGVAWERGLSASLPRTLAEASDWSLGLTELDYLESARQAIAECNFEELALLKEGQFVTEADIQSLLHEKDTPPDTDFS